MNQYFENNEKLKSNITKYDVKIKNTNFSFYTDKGVFNKKGLDYGTRLLLENINIDNRRTFLDVGCGCGPIGIYIAIQSNNNKVDMIDINERAVKLSNMGIKINKIKNAKAFISDMYLNIKSKYDMIITNPPIHAGKNVVYDIVRNAKEYLNYNGELWIVIRKDQGAKSLINDFSNIYEFEIVIKDKGFYVLKGHIK